MPFLAPVVGAIFGLGAVGSALVSAAVGVGVSLLANKLTAKKVKGPGSAQRETGTQLSLRAEPNVERQVIFGRAATAGSLVYWQLSGTSNKTLRMVIALADHQCQGLSTTIWVNGRQRSWNASTKEVSGFGGKLKVHFFDGSGTQAADSALVSSSAGRWTSNERGRHVAYAIVEAEYDEEAFSGGIPEIVFVVDGIRLYDPRQDSTAGGSGSQRWDNPATWTFSANPAVAIYNVLRGIRPGGQLLLGMHVPAAALRYADFAAAANACDETILGEPRYRCGLVAGSSLTNADVLEVLLATMAGELIESGGIYRILAGVTQPIVASLTDADVIVDRPFSGSPRLPRNELVNAVLGSFSDPSRSYASVPLPPRLSSIDEATDGGIRLPVTLDLAGITSRAQAQRVMEIERRRSRRQYRASCTLRSRWLVLEPGDWISFSSDRRGWVNRVFQVLNSSENEDGTVDVSLQEVDDQIDDFSGADLIADDSVVDLGPAGPTFDTVLGFNLTTLAVSSGVDGVSRPGLRATWTPVDDPTVTELVIEYRRQGDTVALERRVLRPEDGAYSWVSGVQGGVTYEARALPVTVPKRAVNWTSWQLASGATAPQIVAVAAEALFVDPENLPPFELSAQEKFELALVTAVEETFGSVNERVEQISEAIRRLSDAATSARLDARAVGAQVAVTQQIIETETQSLASQITALSAQLDDDIAVALQAIETRVDQVEVAAEGRNRVFRQNTTPSATAPGDLWIHTGEGDRLYTATAIGSGGWVVAEDQRIPALVTQTTATATLLQQVSTELDGNIATVSDLSESVDGIKARRVIGVDVDGRAAQIDIEGNQYGNSITFVGDTFYFAHPTVSGGAPIPVAVIRNVGGINRMVFNGQMIVDAILAGEASFATLSAIVADLGTITAGLIRDAANTYRFDVANGLLERTDNTMTIDLKNKRLRIVT